MKRFIPFLLVLAIALPVHAQMLQGITGRVSGGAVAKLSVSDDWTGGYPNTNWETPTWPGWFSLVKGSSPYTSDYVGTGNTWNYSVGVWKTKPATDSQYSEVQPWCVSFCGLSYVGALTQAQGTVGDCHFISVNGGRIYYGTMLAGNYAWDNAVDGVTVNLVDDKVRLETFNAGATDTLVIKLNGSVVKTVTGEPKLSGGQVGGWDLTLYGFSRTWAGGDF